jgi:hypothetical protein
MRSGLNLRDQIVHFKFRESKLPNYELLEAKSVFKFNNKYNEMLINKVGPEFLESLLQY